MVHTATGGSLFVAVAADGAGSAPYGGEGAEHVCRTFFDHIATQGLPEPGQVRQWTRQTIETLREELAFKALARGEKNPSCFATTFLACLTEDEDPSDQSRALFLQVGDGAIVYRCRSGMPWELACFPVRGEYLNETVFVTDERAPSAANWCALYRPVTSIVMMTDGMERLAIRMRDNTPHPPFFEYVLRFLEAAKYDASAGKHLRAFLSSAAVCKRTEDDKTLIVAAKRLT